MTHGFRNLLGVVAAVIVLGAVVHHSGGDSPAAAAPPSGAAVYVKPVVGPVTSEFGPRTSPPGFHGGMDIYGPIGTPIRAVTRGVVIVAGSAHGFGLWMQVRHPDGTVTVYGHMSTMTRAVGAHVAAGELIARVGKRGQATGPHLHFEVWPHGQRALRVDPRPWLDHRGVHY